jgi:hypothetical protein
MQILSGMLGLLTFCKYHQLSGGFYFHGFWQWLRSWQVSRWAFKGANEVETRGPYLSNSDNCSPPPHWTCNQGQLLSCSMPPRWPYTLTGATKCADQYTGKSKSQSTFCSTIPSSTSIYHVWRLELLDWIGQDDYEPFPLYHASNTWDTNKGMVVSARLLTSAWQLLVLTWWIGKQCIEHWEIFLNYFGCGPQNIWVTFVVWDTYKRSVVFGITVDVPAAIKVMKPLLTSFYALVMEPQKSGWLDWSI